MSNVIKFPAMTTKMDRWPNRIRELRDAKGWKQPQLAERVGLSAVMISHLETGRRVLTQDHMRSIARALGVDPVDLLSKDDNPLALDDAAKDFMRLWPHIDEAGREALQSVAEKFAGFRAQPAILDHPAQAESAPEQRPRWKRTAL